MASNRMEHLAEIATGCANHKWQDGSSRAYGAYVRTRFFAGGFGFNTVEEAARYVDQQRNHAIKDGQLDDFSAAIAGASGAVYSLFS